MTRRRLVTFAVAAAALVAAAVVPSSSRAVDTIGYRDMHFSGNGTMVSGAKPESKLWFNDGQWWGVLWDEVRGDNYIYRLDRGTHTWVDTGTMVDPRAGTRADAMWDGTKLWVSSHGYTNTSALGFDARLYRFSYSAATKKYTIDTGFPTVISNWKSETLVIDKDSLGRIWATWVANPGTNSVFVNHSTDATGKTWGTPYVIPVNKGATNINADDISSVISFTPNGGAPRVGVMWSNQNDSAMYFAEHLDSDGDNVWQSTKTAIQGPNEADDHINLKSLQSDGTGRVFAAVKTEMTAAASPLIRLMVRAPNTGDWTSYTFGRKSEGHTRPIVLLDEEHGMLYMFATSGEAGGTIYYKKTPINDIVFASGLGTPFIQDGASADMNDATSTKQNLSSATGLVVLGSNDTTGYYWHNEMDLGTPPLNAEFSGTPTSGVAPLTVNFTDLTSGVPNGWSWDFGDGATSNLADPSHTYAVGGTYTVTLTVTDKYGQTSTMTKTSYVSVAATAPVVASFTANPSVGIAPVTVAFTDTSTGSPTSWAWDFGDGSTSTVQSPSHLYTTPGTYTVTLTASKPGSTNTTSGTVTVNAPAPLAASFSGTPLSGYAPLTVAFTDTSTGTPTGWSWSFGDGGTSTEQHPTHMYLAPGTYDVSLTVTRDAGSSTTTRTGYVTVSNAPATQTLVPVADSFTRSNAPTTNYGTTTSIRVKNGGTSATAYNYDTFIKFTVTGVTGTVTSAKLRLYCIDPASKGGTVMAVADNSWTELGLTAGNQPATGATLGTVGPTTLDAWSEITIPASYFAAGNGTYTLAIKSLSPSDGTTWYSSREGTEPPQLVLTTSTP